jgi:hypothetical protein
MMDDLAGGPEEQRVVDVKWLGTKWNEGCEGEKKK